jgi:hypothetical protein
MDAMPTLEFRISANQHLVNALGKISFYFGDEGGGLFAATVKRKRDSAELKQNRTRTRPAVKSDQILFTSLGQA